MSYYPLQLFPATEQYRTHTRDSCLLAYKTDNVFCAAVPLQFYFPSKLLNYQHLNKRHTQCLCIDEVDGIGYSYAVISQYHGYLFAFLLNIYPDITLAVIREGIFQRVGYRFVDDKPAWYGKVNLYFNLLDIYTRGYSVFIEAV
jgi:hypothetical protein